MTGNLNLLHGLTIDKAYFDTGGAELVIKTTDDKTITIYCYCADGYFDEQLGVSMEDNDSTVLLDTNA